MDNVLNRPLFRHREARNRLNDIAGVQRFQEGSFIAAGSGNPDLSGGSRAPQNVFADPSGAIMRQYSQRSIRPEGLPSIMDQQALRGFRAEPEFEPITLPPGEGPAGDFLYDRVSGEVRLPDGSVITSPAIAETVSRKIQAYLTSGGGSINSNLESGIAVLTEAAHQLAKEGFPDASMDVADRTLKLRGQLSALEQKQADQGKPTAQDLGRSVFSAEGPESAPSQPEALDIFKAFINDDAYQSNVLERAAVDAVPPTPVPGAASPDLSTDMGFEARRGRTAPVVPSAPADRGPLITDPAAVAAGLNAEDPEVREKTVADFMKEYSDAAPEYEGANKNLMLAQIGFAIAAGESPNAMQNIANGLLAGSDMMLKDKAAKDEFNRQIQLASMQYGFGEMSRDKELERSATNYIAARDVVYRGRKFPRGTTVPVLNSDIIKNRLPEGLLDTAFADTLATKEAAVLESLQKQYEQNLIDDTELRANSDAYSALVDEAARLQRGDDYFRTGLKILGRKGEATGGRGALKKFVYQMASAAGINPTDLDSYISDPVELEKVLTRGANAAFRNYLGDEAGNSISNMDVTRNVRSIVAGVTAEGTFEGMFKNEDAVIRDIQAALAENEGQRSRTLGQLGAIEKRFAGRYTKAGSFQDPQSALDVLAPLRESAGVVSTQTPSPGDIVVDENGVWTLYIPEN